MRNGLICEVLVLLEDVGLGFAQVQFYVDMGGGGFYESAALDQFVQFGVVVAVVVVDDTIGVMKVSKDVGGEDAQGVHV